jgi:hypothetical protein
LWPAAPRGECDERSLKVRAKRRDRETGLAVFFSGQDDATCGRTSWPNLNDEILTTEAAYWVNLVQLEPGDA